MGAIASPFSSDRRRRIPSATPGGAVSGQLTRLTHVRPGNHRVISCYIKLEPRDRARGKYLIKLKNRVRTVTDGFDRLGLDREVREAAERDLDRVVERLRNPADLPPTQVLAVAFDRTSARFFDVTAYGARELPGLRADSTRGARFRGERDGAGRGEHTYNNRIREEKQRHFEAIARELFTLDRRRPVHGVILGSAGADANAVRPFLHAYLAERVLGTMKVTPKETTAAKVHHDALAVREEWERASERALVAALGERLGAGWAVNGIPPTLRALARGQVRSLLVHADAAEPGFRCSETGRLALTDRECRGEGEALPVLDVVDDAIEEALRQGVNVNVVYDPDACREIAGLAGVLRFRR